MYPNIQQLKTEGLDRTSECAVDGIPVTLDEEMSTPCRGLCLATAGSVKIITATGRTLKYPYLVAGVIHPISAKKVFSGADTTATNIIATF